MKRILFFSSFVLLSLILNGCGSSNPIVATVGDEKITLQDFENSYAKNNGGWANATGSTVSDRERFLDLLVKFRLKVLEAKRQGLLQDTSVNEELDSYRLSVAQSYMIEKEIIEPKLHEMYDRKLEEIEAAHILIRLPQNPTPADTLAGYNKAMKAISLIPTLGFDSVARAYSEDAQTAPKGGVVGWLVPGRAFPEFEAALYALPQGDYTKIPIRSPYGYHIIKSLKREHARGAIRISHILRRFAPDMKDTSAVRDSIMHIYGLLKRGANFAATAEKYSDDPPSRQRGGDIGYYDRERLRPDIVNLLFDLPDDSVTAPYEQPYGYHIFKVTGHKPVDSFADVEKDLRTTYQQTGYQRDFANYVEGLKRLYNLTINLPVKQELRVAFDSARTPGDSAWSDAVPGRLLQSTLFTYAGKSFTVREFVDSVGSEMEFRGTQLKPGNIDGMIDRFAESRVLRERAATAGDRYPELKRLMDEYLDGILLYRIEQDEVWKKVMVNDSLLRAFYDTTKTDYRWPNRVNFAEIFVPSDSVRKVAEAALAQGRDFLYVAQQYTARAGYRDKLGIWGYQAYNLNDLTQKASTMMVDSVSGFFPSQGGWSNIKVLGKDSARTKSFEECGPELASAYQEQASKIREEQWIKSLKEKYGVTLNATLLSQAFKRKPTANN